MQVHAGSNSNIVTGCYDGSVRLYSAYAGDATVALGHTNAVKAVTFIIPQPSTSSSQEAPTYIVSAGKDKTAKLWRFEEKECTPIAKFLGHSDSIEALAARGAKVTGMPIIEKCCLAVRLLFVFLVCFGILVLQRGF